MNEKYTLVPKFGVQSKFIETIMIKGRRIEKTGLYFFLVEKLYIVYHCNSIYYITDSNYFE